MKKTIRKLMVRHETIRALRVLRDLDLAHAGAAPRFESGGPCTDLLLQAPGVGVDSLRAVVCA